VFRPFIWLLNVSSSKMLKWIFRIDVEHGHGLVHTSRELAALVRESGDSSEVTETERDILINALELNELVVRDIMTPRNDVVCLDVEHTFDENWTLAMESEHTRFPLVQGHMDSTLGFVHVKDLLKQVNRGNPSLLEIRRAMLEVPEMMPLDELLVFFLKNHGHLALAVDEFGGTLGMVTFDNVIEELVGDIQDEFDDEQPEFKMVGDGEYQVDGKLGLHELAALMDLELESPDVSTVGGYVTHLLGHLPESGERVRIENFEVTVTSTDGRRVIEVRFSRKDDEEEFDPGLRRGQAEDESHTNAAT
jgi:CBS domain containing-hemolysin-like protein